MPAIDGSREPPEIRPSPWRSRALLCCAFLLALLVITAAILSYLVALVIVHPASSGGTGLVLLLTLIIASVFTAPIWFLAFRLVRRSNRHRWVSVEDLLTKDRRPPILYLRSFEADEQADRVDGSIYSLAWILFFPVAITRLARELRGSTDEMLWSAALSSIGPVVAVAAPRQLPFRGAARIFVGDADWRRTVADLAHQAALTVVMGGETEGLWWEISNVVSKLPEDRVVYILPNDETRFAQFRTRTLRELEIDIGEKPEVAHRMMACGVLRLIQGEAHITPVWGSSRASIELALEPIVKGPSSS